MREAQNASIAEAADSEGEQPFQDKALPPAPQDRRRSRPKAV